jgi:protein-tyrosine-phosphatase
MKPMNAPAPTQDALRVARFAALGQETRFDVARLLLRFAGRELAAGDIARLVAAVPATMSSHLAVLEDAGLIASRRDGRSILYRAVPEVTGPLLGAAEAPLPAGRDAARERPLAVLFLCTANSARSLMAEAVLARFGDGRFAAYSAGSRPRATMDQRARDLLLRLGYDVAGLAPGSWSRFAGPDAPAIDVVITLCDAAAGENCPVPVGRAVAAHWGVPDPVGAGDSEGEARAAMRLAYRRVSTRVTALAALPVETMCAADLESALAAIARFDGATDLALARAG